MPGITDTNKIDLIARTKDGRAELVIVEEHPWTGTEERLKMFLEKIKTYVAYALGDQFKEMYPDLAQKIVTIKIMMFHEFDPITKKLFDALSEDINKKYQIVIESKIMDINKT